MTNATPETAAPNVTFNAATLKRPDAALLTYYILVSACTLIAFPFVFLPHYFKYKTLEYDFDDKGVSMKWGLLFRKEIYLTYRRIQDIHVRRNLFHRWLGLAAVSVQTASGQAGAEMTIEGIRNPETLRDYLYSRMRGATEDAGDSAADDDTAPADEALALLHEIRNELKSLRESRGSAPAGGAA